MPASTQTMVRNAGREGGSAVPPALSAGMAAASAAAAAEAVAAATAAASNPQPSCPRGYTPVERSLWRQFTENTGAGICDSGGAYGRGWERNRRAGDLKAQPGATVDLDFGLDSPDVSVSPFHRLARELMCAPAMNRRFARFNRRYDPHNVKSWLDVSEAFAAGIDPNFGYYLSYNDEYSVLGQDVQFTSFSDGRDGSEYVLLQVHGGCDARAGYTRPVAYEVCEIDQFVSSLREWSAICGCTDDDTEENLRVSVRCGEFDPDGLDKWPERWHVSDRGLAMCGVCGEEVLFS